jgi:hypothetical protein
MASYQNFTPAPEAIATVAMAASRRPHQLRP